jgi:hypothetical protein
MMLSLPARQLRRHSNGPTRRSVSRETKIRAEKLTYTPKDRWQAAAEKVQIDATFDYQAKQPLKLTGRMENDRHEVQLPGQLESRRELEFTRPASSYCRSGKADNH